jgi:hypothetical protein
MPIQIDMPHPKFLLGQKVTVISYPGTLALDVQGVVVSISIQYCSQGLPDAPPYWRYKVRTILGRIHDVCENELVRRKKARSFLT